MRKLYNKNIKKNNKLKPGAVLCAVVTAGTALLCCGCSETAPEKEAVTLNIKVPPLTVSSHNSDITDAYTMLESTANEFAQQYESADVSINVVKFEYVDEDEFITGTFGTEDATDILFEGYFNMSGYVHTGNVVPLDDIISDQLRADVYQSCWDMSQIDGTTYMLPFYSLQNTLSFNKRLFTSCGLGEYIGEPGTIQNWTLDEWDMILETLARELPEMSYPMMMYAKNDQGDTHIMTLLRSRGCPLFSDDGHFHVNTPEGIAALQWIKDSYDKGYFPAGCENIEILDCNSLFFNDQLAIHLVNNASTFTDPDNIGYVNFPSNGENGINTSFLTGFMVFDNGNEAKIQASKAFLEYFYSQEAYLDYSEVAIPAFQSVAQRDAQYLYMAEAYSENMQNSVDITHNNPNWRGVRDTFYTHIFDLLSGDKTPEAVARDIDKYCNTAIDEGRASSVLHQ